MTTLMSQKLSSISVKPLQSRKVIWAPICWLSCLTLSEPLSISNIHSQVLCLPIQTTNKLSFLKRSRLRLWKTERRKKKIFWETRWIRSLLTLFSNKRRPSRWSIFLTHHQVSLEISHLLLDMGQLTYLLLSLVAWWRNLRLRLIFQPNHRLTKQMTLMMVASQLGNSELGSEDKVPLVVKVMNKKWWLLDSHQLYQKVLLLTGVNKWIKHLVWDYSTLML